MINVSFDFSSTKLTVIPPPQSSSTLHRHEKENHFDFKIAVKIAMTLTLPSPPTALASHHSKRTSQLGFPEVSAIEKKVHSKPHLWDAQVHFWSTSTWDTVLVCYGIAWMIVDVLITGAQRSLMSNLKSWKQLWTNCEVGPLASDSSALILLRTGLALKNVQTRHD